MYKHLRSGYKYLKHVVLTYNTLFLKTTCTYHDVTPTIYIILC